MKPEPDLIAYTWQTPLGVQLVYQPTGGAQLQPARRKCPATIADVLVKWERIYVPILEQLLADARAVEVEPMASLIGDACRAATELAKVVGPEATIDEGPLEAPTPRARISRAVQAPVATEKRRRALIFAGCAGLTAFGDPPFGPAAAAFIAYLAYEAGWER